MTSQQAGGQGTAEHDSDGTVNQSVQSGKGQSAPAQDEDVLSEHSEVLLDDAAAHPYAHEDQEWREREARNELKRVAGLGELQDVTEVEYRKERLERVVLVGVWSSAKTTQAQEIGRASCRERA